MKNGNPRQSKDWPTSHIKRRWNYAIEVGISKNCVYCISKNCLDPDNVIKAVSVRTNEIFIRDQL